MDTRTLLLLGSVALAGYAACMVYDPSLINGPPGTSGGGGSGGGAGSGPGSGSSTASGRDGGGGGSARECVTGKDCPGEDDACKTRACSNVGVCGFDFTQAGTQVPPPTPGDCKVAVCDGQGAVKCVPDHCIDKELGRDETDVDCGGTTCPKCAIGNKCTTGNDCLSDSCPSGTCAPTCTDGAKDGNETDKDCGGACPACATGQGCAIDGDCLSGKCSGGVCADVPTGALLLLSEIQTRGDNGGNDEFIEIYNPTAAPVTFDNTWTVSARSAAGSCGVAAQRFAGGGQVIPPHGHLLFANKAPPPSYNGLTKEDGTYLTGVTDAGEVVLRQGASVVDAVCFFFDAASQANLTTCSPAFLCEGTPVSNAPHDNNGGTTSNVDLTLNRKPGGVLGNGEDTGNNSSDFAGGFTANPQNLMSLTTP